MFNGQASFVNQKTIKIINEKLRSLIKVKKFGGSKTTP